MLEVTAQATAKVILTETGAWGWLMLHLLGDKIEATNHIIGPRAVIRALISFILLWVFFGVVEGGGKDPPPLNW